MPDPSKQTVIVVGASRGLGHGVASGLAEAGATVIAVARTPVTFAGLSSGANPIRTEIVDAADAIVPGRLLDTYEPDAVVLVAGATPYMRPLQQHTWDTFSVNWNTDVKLAFHWLREALLRPMRLGSRMIVFSSGAALNGSPLSGGYAGSKATQRFITGYARDEAQRAGLDITFTAILPQLTPMTDLGSAALKAYATRSGQPDQYLRTFEAPLTPDIAGAALVELLAADATAIAPGYVLGGSGLAELG